MARYKFSKDMIEATLAKFDDNIKLAAKDIGCSYETLRRNIKKYGVKHENANGKNSKKTRKSGSDLALWVENNPDTWKALKPVELAKAAQVEKSAANSFLQYRRTKARKLVKDKPWFNKDRVVTLTTKDGVNIPDSAFDKVTTDVHKRTGDIKLSATLHTGQEYDFVYDVHDLARLYE